jgi:hypothetical protein
MRPGGSYAGVSTRGLVLGGFSEFGHFDLGLPHPGVRAAAPAEGVVEVATAAAERRPQNTACLRHGDFPLEGGGQGLALGIVKK